VDKTFCRSEMLTAVCYWSSSNCNPDKTFCPRQQCFVITVHCSP